LLGTGAHRPSPKIKSKIENRKSKIGKAPTWNKSTEHLYSAWLELLFSAPEGTFWRSLDEVTRDPTRNMLHNHLGLDEDESGAGGLELRPDCADNPYFLRAYFSWKVGAPFGYHKCTRGNRKSPPECTDWISLPRGKPLSVKAFNSFLRGLRSTVHAATARTSLDDDESDLYPVALSATSLRPGTVFADPYGHTLTLSRWVAQTEQAPGILLAVDAQPDGTVTVKRFWRGNFQFATEGIAGECGFKAFRPVSDTTRGPATLSSKAILASSDYGDYSLEQRGMPVAEFYDRMDALINPEPLEPVRVFRQLHDALHEQLLTRVTAVENAETWADGHAGEVVPMPSGPSVFQTSGPWEDFSTPSRDMRLLIALDTLADFPAKVERSPGLFKLAEGRSAAAVRVELEELAKSWRLEYKLSYDASDGVRRTLTLQDIVDRSSFLEVAYNPNDCPEIRWGAPHGSTEASTCKRKAPAEQRKKMDAYRDWFHERRRPVW